MSLWRDDPRPSRATLAALVAVALIAIASLGRVFDGSVYMAWALPALAIGSGFALFFGRRSLGLGFGFLLVGWLLSLPGLFARDESAYGFPTNESFRIAWRLIGTGLRQASRTLPPVSPEPQFMILVWTAFLFLGFLGASWVVVRRPVGAIISALGVVTFAGSLGEGPGRAGYALAAVAATSAFFLAEGRQRIERWSSGRMRVPLLFGVPTLGVACAFALVAPFLIGDTPLVELRSAIRPRVVIIKPLSDIRRQLKVEPPIEVMRVGSARSTYWRLTGLDSYDGREWVLEARPRAVRGGAVSAPEPPTTGDFLEQSYRLTSLLSPWMPAAYAARSVDADTRVEVDTKSQTLLLREDTSPGLAYTVRSQLPRVSQNIPASPRNVTDPSERLFGDLARTIVPASATPLDSARALEGHFHGYAYNEDVEGGHSVQRLQRFLQQKAGYCEQFAATMTLMLRGLGVEARVGVGFLPGANTGSEYIVTTREAHAWVEANIPGAGWTLFDPTPGRGSPQSPASEEAQATPPPAPEETTIPASTPQPQELPTEVGEEAATRIPAAIIWLAVGIAALGAIPVAKRVRRTVREIGEPSDVLLGAYAEMTDRARELGWSPMRAETHREFLLRASGTEDANAANLAHLAGRALYGPPGLTKAEAEAAWAAVPPTLGAMRLRAPAWRRVVAPLDPRTFVPERVIQRLRSRVLAIFAARTAN